jgi:hypothetical protein
MEMQARGLFKLGKIGREEVYRHIKVCRTVKEEL